MKVIATEHGRSTQAVNPDEARPLSGTYFQESSRLVTERYGFSVQPTYDDMVKGGAKYAHGRLISGNKKVNIAELVVYSNAIQITTSTTADSDYVLDDVIAWGKSAIGYREGETRLPRLYESAIIVDFERNVDSIIAAFDGLRKGFHEALIATYGLDSPITLSSFGVGVDPLQVAAQMPPPFPGVLKPEFGLVRRTNHPYMANRFFALAPIRTETHVTLLEEFERALATK